MNAGSESAAGAARKLHIDQLEYCRELSILLYTRDRSMHNLAKKMKSVFNRVYISGEIKDSQRIINKFSHDVSDPRQLIDMILVDFDQSGLKMVDFVNRRVHFPEFKNCPVIPIIVLANEANKPQDIFDHAKGCGGVHKVISYPYTAQEVVLGILEASYMLRNVEHTFRDLQRATVAKAKLPYLPVFDAKSAAKINVIDGEIQKVSVATSMSTVDNNKVEEIDDCGSQCDDVLPDYLKVYQRKPKEKSDPYDFSQYGQSNDSRRLAPSQLNPVLRNAGKTSKGSPLKSSASTHSVTIQEPASGLVRNELSGGFLESVDENHLIPGSATEGNLANSISFEALPMDYQSVISKSTNGVQVDSKTYAETLLGDDSTEYGGRTYMEGGGISVDNGNEFIDEEDEEDRNAIQRRDAALHEELNGLPPLQRLLDKSVRPFWSGALSSLHGIDENIVARARKRTDMEHDISTFVDRPRPKTATTLSVTGLNKRVMDGYWKQLQNSYSGPKDKSAPSTGRTSLGRPSSAASLRQTVADSSSASSLHSLASSSKRPLTPSASSSGLREAGLSKSRKSEDLHKRALRQVSSSESKDNIPNLQDFEINFFTAEEEAELNSSNILGSSVNRSKSPKRRISAQVSTLDMSPIPDGNGQTMSNQANTIAMHELMTREYQASIRAERKIAMLAKEVPADFHVSNVLDVHLTKRRINLGEKGMLEKGLALEKDGDFESASICYSRAGAHSKDPQISRMLLGNLHYRANHLMMALRCYNTAIEIVESKVSGLRVIDDEFLGYHNRAVINFRLGNDSQGLADLQKAVTVNPTNLPARELLSLVKRRMGMYSDAMEDAHVVKIQRIEEDRLKREQAEKLKKQRAAKVRYNHDGKVIIHGRQRSKGVVAGIAHSNQTAESSMTQQQQLLEARQSRESALRGLEIAVPDPSCLSSLRERIASHRSSSANNALDDEDGGMAAGGFLRLFKMTHGMKNELFDEIFIKPTELQMSMLREPHLRTYQDIEIISTSALGVIPYLRNLAPSVLNELSAVVEYRAVSSGGLDSVLFKQNQESPGVCFLLTGNVGVTMETGHVSGIHGVDVVKLQERTAFGHFDLMFHNPRTSFLKSLEEVLVSVRSNITERLRPADHHHDDNNNNNPSAQVQGISHAGGVSSIDHTQHSTSSGSHQMSVAMMMLLNGSGNGSGNHHTMQTALSASQQIQLFEQEKLQQEQLQKEKTDFNQLFYHQVDHQSGKLLSRGVQPGMFMSYIMSGPCELLLINERDFYRILYDHSVKAFQQRIQTLRSCGIFQGWKHEDLIRLARMSQLFTFKRGETILQQAKKPDYLYIIQKGLCKVLKRPNRTEMLMQKLQVAKEKAARIDFKYVYHHGVYNPKDLSWEPLRDLTTPLFAAPTGPSVEELAAAEIAAASAIAVVDQSPAPGNNNNATSGAAGGSSHLPRLSSAATVATGNTMNSRPRTSQSRSSVSSRTDIPRTSSNLTTASAGAHSTTTKSQSQRSQSSRELLHHVDAAQAAAMLHPHDNRLFSPNHAQHPAVSPSAHAPHDGAIAVFSDDVEDADHRYQQHNGSSTHQPGSKHHRAGTTGGMKRRPSHLSTHGSFLSVASASPHHSERRNSIVGHHPGKHNGFRHLDELRSFPTSDVPPAPQQTPHELERQALAREIARLESLIKVAREQDAIDQRNHETQDRVDAMRLKRTESFYSTTSNSTPLSSKGECTKGGDGVPIEQALASQLNRKQAEIKLLQWPMIFGEACVLQPDVGVSRGSIVADTTVECIVLHRMQLQTFAVDDHFLDRVRDKAVVYPGDPDIVVDLFRKQNWQQYKLEVMQDISKSRWPKRLDDLESFVV